MRVAITLLITLNELFSSTVRATTPSFNVTTGIKLSVDVIFDCIVNCKVILSLSAPGDEIFGVAP